MIITTPVNMFIDAQGWTFNTLPSHQAAAFTWDREF